MTPPPGEKKIPDAFDKKREEYERQGFVFRKATADDAQAIIDFHNTIYAARSGPEHSKTRRGPEHWIWEYQTYAPDQSTFLIAEKDGQVLAIDGDVPVYMEVAGQTVLCASGQNSLCHPDYRGKGLMQAMKSRARANDYHQHFRIAYGLSFIPSLVGRNNLTTVFKNVQVWVRPGNLRMAMGVKLGDNTPLWRRLGSIAKMTISSLRDKRTRTLPEIEKRAGYEVARGQIPLGALSDLRDRLREKYEHVVWLKYDDRFINWRIREHPFLRYTEYQALQDGVLRGYAFVTCHDGEACISDLTSEDPHATSLLLTAIVQDNAETVGRFRFMGNPRDLMAEDLFEQLPEFGFSLSMKWHITAGDRERNMGKEFYQIRNWHINGLWTEGFLY